MVVVFCSGSDGFGCGGFGGADCFFDACPKSALSSVSFLYF